MAPAPAKLVTIVTPFSARQRVVDVLTELGVRGYTAASVEGHGVHGDRVSSLFEHENVAFTIVVSGAIAAKLLAWVEDELAPTDPSIAYCADVVAVPAGHFA